MVKLLKIILFFISNLGFWELLRRKTHVDIHFLPVLTIALQSSILIYAGFLNLLPETAVILYLFGFAVIIIAIIRDRSIKFVRNYYTVGYLFLFAGLLGISFFLRGKLISSYDNFSHWALIVKTMLRTDRLPNFQDLVIRHQEYPAGSSVYIYLFSKFTVFSDSVQMFSQLYMMLSCVLPLFIFAPKNRGLILLFLASAANFFLVYSIPVTSLMVDTLLPLAGSCAFLYAYLYGRVVPSKPAFYFNIFMFVWLVQIKNSGLFFLLFLFILMIRNLIRERKILPYLIVALSPFVSLVLWQKHCDYVFLNAETSKHALTFRNFSHVFGQKSPETVSSIISSFISFVLTYKELVCVLVFVVIGGSAILFHSRKKIKQYISILLFDILMFLIYQVGLLGMYLFSMPANEAAYLASADRYEKTILIAAVYLLTAVMAGVLSEADKINLKTVLLSMLMLSAFPVYEYMTFGNVRFAVEYTESPARRIWLESAKNDFVMNDDETYCILTATENDKNYFYHLGKYVLETDQVRTKIITDMDQMDEITDEFIFIYDQKNEIIQRWIMENYPEQVGNRVIHRWDLYQ